MQIDLTPHEMLVAITAIKRYWVMEETAEVTASKLEDALKFMHRSCPGGCGHAVYDDPSVKGKKSYPISTVSLFFSHETEMSIKTAMTKIFLILL